MENKLRFYLPMPSLKQFGGIKVTKETVINEVVNDDIKQTLKDLVLITEVNSERDYEGRKIIEKSSVETTLLEGDILIYVEERGYILPTQEITTLEELKVAIDEMNDIFKEDNNEKESI